MLVIFVFSIFVLVGFTSIVVDIAWYWANELKVQRASDAAALAGVVYLPGDIATAVSTANAIAAENGYTAGTGGVTVTPVQDVTNDRQLDVTVSAPVQTFFMRLFGISSIQATESSKAQFELPIPMGSPQNYYGVYQLTRAIGATTAIPNATGSGTLASQGNWGAVITKGGDHGNGDAYSPTSDSAQGGVNPDYTSNGYAYTIYIPPGDSGGMVFIFDPEFCGVGAASGGNEYGMGDHWIGNAGTTVSTFYNLYNENNSPYDYSSQIFVTGSGSLFTGQDQTDQSTSGGAGNYVFGTPQQTTANGARDCSADTYHNNWWTMATGLAAGTYRLQVTTTDPNNANTNTGTNAENTFSIEATATGAATPSVHGEGSMAVLNTVVTGSQVFYLAQIPKTYAGKTLEIDLFDVGDVNGTGFLKVLDPDGNAYNAATFNYTADGQCASNCSGSGITSLQTTFSGGSHPYNDSWLTILIPLPSTYGSVGLTPSGEPGAGWWKIEYDVTGAANDTTTWRTSIRGNPVHLIVP
jgi:hypothetical protein